MKPRQSVAGLILAGGASRRMGTPKALLAYHGETFLDRLIRMFGASTDPVIVVLGHEPESILGGVERAGEAVVVINREYRLGQLSSLQRGLGALPEHSRAVLFSPVDYAAVLPSTVEALARSAAAGAALVYPRHLGQRGHPVACSRALAAEILALAPESEARVVTRRHIAEAVFVEVDDPAILRDIDDPADYRDLIGERP